jgi:hypothetical protein
MTKKSFTIVLAAAGFLLVAAFAARVPLGAQAAPSIRPSTSTDLNGFLAATLMFGAAEASGDGVLTA